MAGFCAGPILGGVLTVAAIDGAPLHGGLLLAVCAIGMTLPMFVLALLWDPVALRGSRAWSYAPFGDANERAFRCQAADDA